MSAPDAGLSRQAARLFQQGHYREAEQLFRRLAGQEPDNWQYALMLGLCRNSQGDFDGAAKWLEKATDLGDAQPSTHYYYGRILTDNRQPGKAREQYAQAIALDPNHVEARTGMGVVSLMTGNFKRAASELKTALRADPKHVPALAALARALVELGDAEQAYQHALKAVKIDSSNPGALDALGRALFGLGRLDLAEEYFNSALEIRPGNGDTHAALAELLKAAGRDREAIEHYIPALERDAGGSKTVIDASVCLERTGDFGQARRLMRKAAERWPDDVGVVTRLAELIMLDGRPEAAREVLAPLDPADPAVITMQARIASVLGRDTEARDLLDRLVASDEDAELREARMLLASTRSRLDPSDLEAARAPLAPLLERRIPIPDAVLVWSTVCENAGDFERAIEALEGLIERDAVVSDTDRAVLHTRLANCYDRTGQPAQAWAHWQKGAWRPAPHAARLDAQRSSGMLDAWLAHEWAAIDTQVPDDGYPVPVIVAGWPGSGREIVLAGLAAHPEVTMLSPEGTDRRLEALSLPLAPAGLASLDEATISVGRRRFMRGIDRQQPPPVLLEGGWWNAAAVPALARFFPGTIVIAPEADAGDLAIQWRVDGYTDIDTLEADHAREAELWQHMREHLPLTFIDVARAELLDDPAGALGRVLGELGLTPDPVATEAAESMRTGERFVPAGHGKQYR